MSMSKANNDKNQQEAATALQREIEETNRKLVKYCPELASEYGRYPIKRVRWLDLKEKGPKGEKLFLRKPKDKDGTANSKEEPPMIPDYVYGRGPFGDGYYSLLTKFAHPNLYSRHTHNMPNNCCLCFQSPEAKKSFDEWDDVKRILFSRVNAKQPDDQVAYYDGIASAQQTAQMWYNATQNEALAVNTVNTINFAAHG